MDRDAAYIGAFLERVARSWREVPDSRFGQFCSNVARDRPLGRMSDAEFEAALDEDDARRAAWRTERARTPREPLDPELEEASRRTREEYRVWALKTFGRVGRDPARIEGFLDLLGEAWADRPDVAFGRLVVAIAGPNLRLLEEEAFLFLLDNPGSISDEAIEASYTYRGPLGDLLRRLEANREPPQ